MLRDIELDLSEYKIGKDLFPFVPQEPYGQFDPSFARPEFLNQLNDEDTYVLIAIHSQGGEYASVFAPEEWYSLPGSVFFELLRAQLAPISTLADGRFVQFFYLKRGDELLDSRDNREGNYRVVREAIINGKPISLFYDTEYKDYVLYCASIQLTSYEETESGVYSPDSATDQLVRLNQDEQLAKQAFTELCQRVQARPDMTLQQLYSVMEEISKKVNWPKRKKKF